MPEYDGKDRRQHSEDHDLLININNKLHNLVEIYSAHVKEDKEKLGDHEQRLRFLERSIFGWFGALAVLQLVLKFLIK